MKKILVLLDAFGIVICICILLIYGDVRIFEVLALFLMSIAYTIWQEKILRFGTSLKWNYSYDMEPTKFAYITANVVTVLLTVGGYIGCAHYFFTLS